MEDTVSTRKCDHGFAFDDYCKGCELDEAVEQKTKELQGALNNLAKFRRKEHSTTPDCWCDPEQNLDGIWVHKILN